MKEKGIYFVITGMLLYAIGVYCIICMNITVAPVFLFLGACMLCLSSGFPSYSCRELFMTYPPGQYQPFPHEPVFLARLFLSMSWISRSEGILALEAFKNDLKQHYFLIFMGKQMIIEGYEPDYVRTSIENVVRLTREQINLKARALRQVGCQAGFIGLFSGIAGGFSYGFLWLQGRGIPTDGFAILFALTMCFLMLSIVFVMLIPANLKNVGNRLQIMQRQALLGLLAVQNGDSSRSILQMQSTFLSVEELELLAQNPLLEEAKEIAAHGNYEETATNIRQMLSDITSV